MSSPLFDSSVPAWPVYDPATHTSTMPDGRRVPHVTEILEAVGVSTDFKKLATISPRAAAAIVLAGPRGSAVHADCHAYDDDDLDLAQVDPRVLPYVDAWAECRTVLGLAPVAHARERYVFHEWVFYSGILDGIFRLPDGRRVLGDIKTGDPESAATHLQTAGYELAYCAMHPGEAIDERWAIWLQPRRRIPYRIINYTEHPQGHLDGQKFLACVTVYNEQPARRI